MARVHEPIPPRHRHGVYAGAGIGTGVWLQAHWPIRCVRNTPGAMKSSATELRAMAKHMGALRATVGIELLLPLVEHIVPGIYQWLDPQLFDGESHNAFD